MRSWSRLFIKDLKGQLFLLVFAVLLNLAWQFFLYTRYGNWPGELAAGLGFLPFFFLPLLMLITGYQSFREEWRDETIYFLLSLPRPGWFLALSKLAAAMTSFLSISLLGALFLYLFHHQKLLALMDYPQAPPAETTLKIMALVALGYVAVAINFFILGQFSYLVSKIFNRGRWLISIVVFFGSGYILQRLALILAPVFGWVPPLSFKVEGVMNGQPITTSLQVDSGPFLAALLILGVIFFLGSWILENYLEV